MSIILYSSNIPRTQELAERLSQADDNTIVPLTWREMGMLKRGEVQIIPGDVGACTLVDDEEDYTDETS